MSAVTNYRAKCSCHIGGLYRRAGDEFSLPTLKEVPAHLEAVKPAPADATVADDSKAAPAAPKRAKGKTGKATVASVPEASKVDKTDLGIGEVKSVADVTSADMVHK